MRVGVFVDDLRIQNINISQPEQGNPGVGGTPFCFAMLLRFMKMYYPEMELYFYHGNRNVIWPAVNCEQYVSDVYSAARIAKRDNCDCFLFRFGVEGDDLYCLFDELKLKAIGWEHNFIDYSKLEQIKNHPYFVRNVFVGCAQYYRYIDHDAIKKCTVIENMLFSEHIPNYKTVSNKNVIYAGQISELKGFSYFIKKWKEIIEKVPDAALYVMGNGKLYNRNSELGPLGLADINYEKTFMDCITDENGKILESIHFLGVVGKEKNDYFGQSRVGVVNPVGSETLCITALEMEASGLPVVSRRKNGTLYSIDEGKTGLLFDTPDEMVESIVSLLNDDDRYIKHHANGPGFVKSNFSPELICSRWYDLFLSVCTNKDSWIEIKNNKSHKPIDKAITINRALRKVFKFLPPLCWYSYYLRKIRGYHDKRSM